jgi:putative ABC transport system substrate-binding protein
MRDLGYVDGRNIVFEWRFADSIPDRLAPFAQDLVRLNVDVIFAGSGVAIRAAHQATTTIPIVMMATADPIGSGFALSLARPGKNMTGSSAATTDYNPKQIELLKAAVPDLSRIAILGRSGSVSLEPVTRAVQEAAKRVGIAGIPFGATGQADDFERHFAAMRQEGVGAMIIAPDPNVLMHRRKIAELAVQYRIPSLAASKPYVEAGFLMSYGPDRNEYARQAAVYVDKILKGSKAGDLPIVQPTRLPFIINLKTAALLGLQMPSTLLALANEVIE